MPTKDKYGRTVMEYDKKKQKKYGEKKKSKPPFKPMEKIKGMKNKDS